MFTRPIRGAASEGIGLQVYSEREGREAGPLVRVSTVIAVGLCGALSAALLWPDTLEARREIRTAEEKARLRKASRIHLEVVALTDRGHVDPTPIASLVTERLEALGYDVVPTENQPDGLSVRVKCEERKTWEGPVRSGGGADLPNAVARLWRGPACQMTYRLGHRRHGWRHEVLTTFQDPIEAARAAGVADPGGYALARLAERLREDPFPFLLAAEWGHTERLLDVLRADRTTAGHKVTVIRLLGDMYDAVAIPTLARMAQDPDPTVANASAVALGAIGSRDAIPVLLDILKTGSTVNRVAAVQGLGRLAPLHPQADIVRTLLDVLPDAPVLVQTAIVRALSTTTDRRALGPLRRLNTSVQTVGGVDVTPEVRELKRALGIALDQYDGVHNVEGW